jgi:hypothetical protein
MKEEILMERGQEERMPTPQKSLPDRTAGERMLTQVFATVQRLNAAAGKSMVQKGSRSGTMTFNPKIILDEDGSKRYTCFVEIYTRDSSKTGIDMSVEWSSTDVEHFKEALTTLLPALSALAKEGYLSDTFTVGRIDADEEETEVYAPPVLEPGMYSLSEQ